MSTPWDQKESEDRIEKFVKAYQELEKTYNCRFIAFPEYVPSGQHGFHTITRILPIDLKNQPVPSPLQDKPIIQ